MPGFAFASQKHMSIVSTHMSYTVMNISAIMYPSSITSMQGKTIEVSSFVCRKYAPMTAVKSAMKIFPRNSMMALVNSATGTHSRGVRDRCQIGDRGCQMLVG